MKKIIIIGAGGQGKESVQLLRDVNKVEHSWDILFFVDDDVQKHGLNISGIRVKEIEELLRIDQSADAVYFYCAIGDCASRKALIDRISRTCPYIKPATIIHPSAIVADDASIGVGSIIGAQAVISSCVKIGNHALINYGSLVGHDSVIGDYTTISPGCKIAGNVILGDSVDIGIGASIIPGVKVGEGSTVGAGAVVIRDLPNSCTAVGVPAKVIKVTK